MLGVDACHWCGPLRLLWLLPVAAWRGAEAKIASGSIYLGGSDAANHWRYVDKFGVAVGDGSYAVRAKLDRPDHRKLDASATVEMDILTDEDWESAMLLPACGHEGRSSRAAQSVPLRLDPDGAWSDWQTGVLQARSRPYIAYFALKECRNEFSDGFQRRVRYEIKALQHDGCQFSFELRYMPSINSWMLGLLVTYTVYFAIRCFSFYQSAGSFHPVLMVLTAVVAIHVLAESFHMLNLFVYSIDGRGMKPIEMLSEVMLMLAQVLVTSLFLCIGLGYTLLEQKENDMESVAALTAVMFAVHGALVSLGHLDDSHDKHHQNAGLVGYAMLVIRLGIYGWFMWGIKKTNEAGGLRMQAFLNKFSKIGCCYFLSYPVIFAIAKLCPHYYQHPVLQVGLLVMQFASIIWLSHLFLTRGEYFKLSTLNTSALPCGPKAGITKGA
eukprot:TRINITY_DN40302_c0_g1_i1.p1 TRINITY_DN40302_c0_g1~~TRINITY_DN40302_c0_g1_i1.p1  ORF type:complete len:440 (+),score=71.70 TRINITY_DN40302_c0_g1_i1:67-1386(+)